MFKSLLQTNRCFNDLVTPFIDERGHNDWRTTHTLACPWSCSTHNAFFTPLPQPQIARNLQRGDEIHVPSRFQRKH